MLYPLVIAFLSIIVFFLYFSLAKLLTNATDIHILINNKKIENMVTLSSSQSVVLNVQPVDRFQNNVSEGLSSITAIPSNPEFFTVTPGDPGVFVVKGISAGSGTIVISYQQRPELAPITKTVEIVVTGEPAVDLVVSFGEPFDTP